MGDSEVRECPMRRRLELALPRANYDSVWVAPLLLVAGVVGLSIPFLDGKSVVLGLGVAAMPGLAALVGRWPVVSLGVYTGAQFMEAFEVQTPVGSISAGIVLLALILLIHRNRVLDALTHSAAAKVATAALAGWLVMHLTRLSYAPPSEVARQLITNGSFVAAFLVGMAFARTPGAIKAFALGAVFTLFVCGLCGVLVAYGMLPAPARIEDARPIFGFTSPIQRNYGLNVAYDAIAFLGPVCIPYLVLTATRNRYFRYRVAAGIALTILALIFLIVFQARGLLLQLAVALVLLGALRARRLALMLFLLVVLPMGIRAAIDSNQTIRATQSATSVSTQLRIASNREVFKLLHDDPAGYVLGRDEAQVFLQGAADSGNPQLLIATQNFHNVIHNLFLGELVGGGYAALLLVAIAYGAVIVRAFALLRSDPADARAQLLFMAMCLTTVALAVEPGTANIVGSWLIFGLVVGQTLPHEVDD